MAKSFSKVGQWKQVSLLTKALKTEFLKAQILSLKRFGLKVEQVAVKHMNTQDLNWDTLSPAYLAAKIRRGESELILIATSSYMQAITSYVINDSVYAGVKATSRDKKGNIADHAKLLEFLIFVYPS